MEIGLVSCTKSKREQAREPADLYTPSALFRKAREYVERYHDEWYVLSARHHLLDPHGPPVEPYDETLRGASLRRKREWAETVQTQLRDEGLLADGNTLVFHAGRDYYDELRPRLDGIGIAVETPTAGLGIGETLAWYDERL